VTQTAELTASDGDGLGSPSISGNTLVVGAPYATVGGNQSQGAVYVFTTPTLIVTPDAWTLAGLTLTLGSDGNLHVYTTGTTTDAVPPCPPASVSNIEITSPSSTTANLTIDSTNGDPIPAGGLDYSGGGGLIITGSGTVNLSGTNTYTGGTTVSAGTLIVNAAGALPDGTSLTVGAGGTFIFDPSQSASSATTAAPVTTNVVSSIPTSSATAVANVAKHNTSGHNSQSLIVPSAALQPPQSFPAAALGTPIKRIAGDLAWLAQAANSSDNSDQQRKKDVAILALEAVFAQYNK
jgi:autotransporter-associated beta strand protein